MAHHESVAAHLNVRLKLRRPTRCLTSQHSKYRPPCQPSFSCACLPFHVPLSYYSASSSFATLDIAINFTKVVLHVGPDNNCRKIYFTDKPCNNTLVNWGRTYAVGGYWRASAQARHMCLSVWAYKKWAVPLCVYACRVGLYHAEPCYIIRCICKPSAGRVGKVIKM